MTHSVPHPIHLADAHSDIAPHKYVIIERKQRCDCCGAVHSWSEVYALTYIRSRLEVGKYVTNLRHVDQPKYRLPIEQLRATKVARVPFCHGCFHPTLEHTNGLLEPETPDPNKVLGSSFKPTVVEAPKAARPKTRRHTVDDILEMFK